MNCELVALSKSKTVAPSISTVSAAFADQVSPRLPTYFSSFRPLSG